MPNKAKPIKVTVTGGVKGQPLSVVNRTNDEQINTTLGTGGKVVIDLQNFTNGYTAGDVIDFSVSGEKVGSNSLTTIGDRDQSVTVSSTAISASITRGVR
jgi:hypothetical protein